MRTKTLATLLFIFAVSVSAMAQKAKNTVVRTTIADSDVMFAPLSIHSDHLGTYLNGSNSVISHIQGIGDWEMSVLSSAVRRVQVRFDDAVAGTNPNNLPAPMNGYHTVRFLTQCSPYGSNLLNLTFVGQSAICGMIVAVDIGSDRYSLRFYSQNFPGSDNISVVCTAVASGKCSGWRTQSPNGDGKLIAQLYKVTTVRNQQVLTDYGKYRFSFDLSFAKP